MASEGEQPKRNQRGAGERVSNKDGVEMNDWISEIMKMRTAWEFNHHAKPKYLLVSKAIKKAMLADLTRDNMFRATDYVGKPQFADLTLVTVTDLPGNYMEVVG